MTFEDAVKNTIVKMEEAITIMRKTHPDKYGVLIAFFKKCGICEKYYSPILDRIHRIEDGCNDCPIKLESGYTCTQLPCFGHVSELVQKEEYTAAAEEIKVILIPKLQELLALKYKYQESNHDV